MDWQESLKQWQQASGCDRLPDEVTYTLQLPDRAEGNFIIPIQSRVGEIAGETTPEALGLDIEIPSSTNLDHVACLRQQMQAGDWFPTRMNRLPQFISSKEKRAIVYYLWDGNHTLLAWLSLNLPMSLFPAQIELGSRDDAIARSLFANTGNDATIQLPLNNETRRLNLFLALLSDYYLDMSQNAIGASLGIAKSTTSRWSTDFKKSPQQYAQEYLGRELSEIEIDRLTRTKQQQTSFSLPVPETPETLIPVIVPENAEEIQQLKTATKALLGDRESAVVQVASELVLPDGTVVSKQTEVTISNPSDDYGKFWMEDGQGRGGWVSPVDVQTIEPEPDEQAVVPSDNESLRMALLTCLDAMKRSNDEHLRELAQKYKIA